MMVAELALRHRQAKCPRLAKRLWVAWQARLGRTEPAITALSDMARWTVQGWVRRYNRQRGPMPPCWQPFGEPN